MPLIKYSNKGFLSEHPFNLLTDMPPFLQTHSYIFPTDEIVMGHKLSFPNDANIVSMNDMQFVSAKLSIIAQKPNVYSEEYSRVYAATRSFILDSYIYNFNSSNVPVIQWGINNADGYAPFINFKNDRNWKLPSGDFRRQINLFTKHTNSTSVWDYYFYFPIMFRWEYWIPLLTADNDFYDITQPQNGQNNFWTHYSVFPKWLIKSRLELTVLINGVSTIIRNDFNLSQYTQSISDYNSNPDWTNKAIKTSSILGTPTNTPAFIYGNQNTEVFGYFDKVSSWGGDEQGAMSAVVRIEALEGNGVPATTRGSSLYPVDNNTVFSGLDTSLTDDSGIGITDDSGEYIVTDGNGNGATLIFDGVYPEKVQVFAIIDKDKFARIYPSIRNFRIYIRLYNKSLITGGNINENPVGQTKMGEEIYLDVSLVNPQQTNTICSQLQPACPFNLDVFASVSDADPIQNDKSDFLQQGDGTIQSKIFILQKQVASCGDWADVKIITDNTYGKFFAYGTANDFSGNAFIDDYGIQYTGLLLEWRKVISDGDLGTGTYRMKMVTQDFFGNDPITIYDQRVFCLKAFNCTLANGTVRIEMINEGLRGSYDNPKSYTDYQGGWNGQIRLSGLFFEDTKPSYVNEFIEYDDSRFNAKKPNISELHPKFILELKPIPGWMDRYLKNYLLLADEMLITDYNNVNINPFISFPVINGGGFESTRETYAASERLASAKISLDYGQDNLRKRNSQ